MKRIELLIITAMICGLAFTSCGSDVEAPKLNVYGTKSGLSPSGITDLVFTGDDIVSFEAKFVGELAFTKEKTDEIISRARDYSELHFFLDGRPVFSPPIKINWGLDSWDDLDLKFLILDDGIMLLIDTTMFFECILWVDESYAKAHAEKMQKRGKELDVLIKYLSNTGKVVKK